MEQWPGSATITAVCSQGTREGKPQDETRTYVSSLRTGAEALFKYREDNGVQILATLRSLAINAVRLDGIWSITEGIAALTHDINGLLRLLG